MPAAVAPLPEPTPPVSDPGRSAAPVDAAATVDPKHANVVYHDWESQTYDEKWSISFDERCVEYAVGRFRKAVPRGDHFARVLEIGCGTGFFALNLWQGGLIGEVHATDISPGMVEVCVANGRRLGCDVHGRAADAEALPYPDESFDLVLAHAVVHHLPDLDGAFSEALRVLKPGGRLVIAGEPTRTGDAIAGLFKSGARIAAKSAAIVFGAERVLQPWLAEVSESERETAALELHVDLHIFTPEDLEELAWRAGFDEVFATTEELTASWFGWTNRTLQGILRPGLLGPRFPWFAFYGWQRLFALDELLSPVVPRGLYYNCILSARKP